MKFFVDVRLKASESGNDSKITKNPTLSLWVWQIRNIAHLLTREILIMSSCALFMDRLW